MQNTVLMVIGNRIQNTELRIQNAEYSPDGYREQNTVLMVIGNRIQNTEFRMQNTVLMAIGNRIQS